MTDRNLAMQLKENGINCMGYGLGSKYPALDPDLLPGNRVLLFYLYSNADSKTLVVHTNKEKICAELGISENTFYEYRKPLIEQGYISIAAGAFKRVSYVIEDKPHKFNGEPKDPKHAVKYSLIRKFGLFHKSIGYGFIPRVVMSDPRLDVIGKLEYAYQCVFASKGKGDFTGKGRTAKPKLKHILFHLNICTTTYYKHYRQLCEYNYITPYRQHNNGRFDGNIYLLNENPDEEKATEKVIMLVQTDKKPVCERQRDIQSAASIPAHGLELKNTGNEKQSMNVFTALEQVKSDLLEQRCVPYHYNKSRLLAETAVKYMTEYDLDELHDDKDRAFALFCDALTDLICLQGTLELRKSAVTYAAVIDRLSPFMEFTPGRSGYFDDFISISELCDVVCNKFLKWCAIQCEDIPYPLNLMKTFIWTELINGRAQMKFTLENY